MGRRYKVVSHDGDTSEFVSGGDEHAGNKIIEDAHFKEIVGARTMAFEKQRSRATTQGGIEKCHKRAINQNSRRFFKICVIKRQTKKWSKRFLGGFQRHEKFDR